MAAGNSSKPSQLQIGAIRVDRVEEFEPVPYDAEFLFRDTPVERLRSVIDENLEWMAPWAVHPISKQIYLSFHCFVLRSERVTVLVDSCVGNDKERPEVPRWHKLNTRFLDGLASLGVSPEAVNFVLCTHLHADHVGWNTRLVNGRWIPTFSNAKYLVSEVELEFWTGRNREGVAKDVNDSAFADSVVPIIDAGLLQTVACGQAVSLDDAGSELRFVSAPGHSPGAMQIELQSGDHRAVFSGDTVHHPLQIADPQIGLFSDHDPVTAKRTRIDFIDKYVNASDVILPGHFTRAGRIECNHAGQRRFSCLEV